MREPRSGRGARSTDAGRSSGQTAGPGWEPLRKPPRGPIGQSPFSRLAITYCAGVAGDTLVTMALAGSLFFSISPSAARGRVAAYLLLTMAPFAVVAPLIGPALDRAKGGRRFIVIGTNAIRAVVCLMMVGHLDSLLLFPEAFAVLVLSKAYHVAKSALVPTVVHAEDELVRLAHRLRRGLGDRDAARRRDPDAARRLGGTTGFRLADFRRADDGGRGGAGRKGHRP